MALFMNNGFGKDKLPKPNVITPSMGKNTDIIEKFLMMYTCKVCSGRNSQMVRTSVYSLVHGPFIAVYLYVHNVDIKGCLLQRDGGINMQAL